MLFILTPQKSVKLRLFSVYSDKKIIPGKTFFFFDEIQKYKEIVTKIKFLVEDQRFRYIMYGSLLGVEIVNLKSAPVDYLQTLPMYPLDFEEFLQIFNVDEAIFHHLRTAYESKTPVDELIHNKIIEMFHLYLIIGGMPADVEKHRTVGNIDDVMKEHRAIIEQYKLDFTQYEESPITSDDFCLSSSIKTPLPIRRRTCRAMLRSFAQDLPLRSKPHRETALLRTNCTDGT